MINTNWTQHRTDFPGIHPPPRTHMSLKQIDVHNLRGSNFGCYSWDPSDDPWILRCCNPGALQGSNPGSYRQQNGRQVLPPNSRHIVGAWCNALMNTGTSPQSTSVCRLPLQEYFSEQRDVNETMQQDAPGAFRNFSVQKLFSNTLKTWTRTSQAVQHPACQEANSSSPSFNVSSDFA